MKKLFGLLLIAIIALSSCADSKTFERADGTKFVAEPYGWANYQTKKIEGVTYEACIGNIVWDVIAGETIVIPIWRGSYTNQYLLLNQTSSNYECRIYNNRINYR